MGFDFVDGDLPCLFGFHPSNKAIGLATPPVDFGLEFLKAHRLGFVVAFNAFRVGVFIIPDMLSWLALCEKQQVGFNAGVRVKYTIGQAHNGVQVAFLQQFFLEPGFHTFAKEETIGQDHSGTALTFEQVNNQRNKQIGGFAGTKCGREVVLDAVFFHAAKGWVGDNNVDTIFAGIVTQRAAKGVVVLDVGGCVDTVQYHVGDAQHIR